MLFVALGPLTPRGLLLDETDSVPRIVAVSHSYKQQKFNLMREESEGYSKLVSELLADMGPPHDSATGLSVESQVAAASLSHVGAELTFGLRVQHFPAQSQGSSDDGAHSSSHRPL